MKYQNLNQYIKTLLICFAFLGICSGCVTPSQPETPFKAAVNAQDAVISNLRVDLNRFNSEWPTDHNFWSNDQISTYQNVLYAYLKAQKDKEILIHDLSVQSSQPQPEQNTNDIKR